MNALDFAHKLSEQANDFTLDKWALELCESVARHTVYLAEYFERIPSQLTDEYVAALSSALQNLPKSIRIQVSSDLLEKVTDLSPSLERSLLHKMRPAD